MSQDSVTSTASRIRQFGLYRTIDARADDFIRSSRRKQIRQGCACAAISTAITVTIVVSVILMYEYSTHSNLNKNLSAQRRWFELKKENYPTETNSKFEKKIDFHTATFELLPILFNVLNDNLYANNVVEEHSTTISPQEEKTESEINFQRKILSDAKNWFKMPLLKRNTDDYKLSSLVYPKRSSQYSRYLRNIRKKFTEDRLLKYFDKMLINDKVSKTKPYTLTYYIDTEYTENPMKRSNHTNRNKTRPMILNTQFKTKKRKLESYRLNKANSSNKIYINQPRKENQHCMCPKNTGALLNKLTQTILETASTRTYSVNKTKCESCINGVPIKSTTIINTKFSNHPISTPEMTITTTPTVEDTLTDPTNTRRVLKPSIQNNIIKPTIGNIAKGNANQKLLKAIKNTTKMSKFKIKVNGMNALPKPLSTGETNTTKVTSYLAYTPPKYNTTVIVSKLLNLKPSKYNTSPFPPKTSVMMEKIMHRTATTQIPISTFKSCDSIPEASVKAIQSTVLNDEAERYYKVQNSSAVPANEIKNSYAYVSTHHPEWKTNTPSYKDAIASFLSDKEYEDYFQSTPQVSTGFENLDIHTFELLKLRNMMPSTSKKKKYSKFSTHKKTVNKPPPDNVVPYGDNLENIDTFISLNLPETTDYDVPPSTTRYNNENEEASNLIFSKHKPSESWRERLNELHILRKFAEAERLHLSHLKKDQGTYEILEDDDYQEEWKQKSDDTSTTIHNKYIIYYNDTNTDDHSFEDNKKTFANDWKITRGKTYFENSMLPLMRPPHQDIQHSDEYKPKESTDYDINLANNIFDLPNI